MHQRAVLTVSPLPPVRLEGREGALEEAAEEGQYGDELPSLLSAVCPESSTW